MSQMVRFTTADLEALPDTLDGTRYELIDGELLVAKQPRFEHQFSCGMILLALQTWSRQTGRGMANFAPGVIFSPEDAVAPDVVWISRERLTQGLRPDGHLYVAPELMVEVLSPGSANERRDRELKLKLYAREGVDEYWLVDWRARTVAVYRRADGVLLLADTLAGDDTLTSLLLPDFACPLSDLWETPAGDG